MASHSNGLRNGNAEALGLIETKGLIATIAASDAMCKAANVTLAGRKLHADATGQDMYAAIDLLVDKLDRQLLKHKEKQVDHHRGESLAKSGALD